MSRVRLNRACAGYLAVWFSRACVREFSPDSTTYVKRDKGGGRETTRPEDTLNVMSTWETVAAAMTYGQYTRATI